MKYFPFTQRKNNFLDKVEFLANSLDDNMKNREIIFRLEYHRRSRAHYTIHARRFFNGDVKDFYKKNTSDLFNKLYLYETHYKGKSFKINGYEQIMTFGNIDNYVSGSISLDYLDDTNHTTMTSMSMYIVKNVYQIFDSLDKGEYELVLKNNY